MRRRIGVVLFDFDGTLVDSVALILRSFRHTMTLHLGAPRPDAEWLATLGTPLRIQLRRFARDEREARAMMETYLEYQRRHDREWIRPYPGVPETLRRLAADGYRLGIVSSKLSDGILRGLELCGIPADLFDCVVGAERVERAKPDPEPVRAALAELGAEPPAALFVGDSVHDLRAGRTAGTFTAAALWGPFGRTELAAGRPDFWLSRIEAVFEVLDGFDPAGTPAAPLSDPEEEPA